MTDSDQRMTTAPRVWSRAWFWPAVVVGLLVGQIVLLLTMVSLAVSDPSFAVEPDYYQKGLNWDSIAAQRARNRKLGWHVAVEVGPDVDPMRNRQLACVLTDRNGIELANAIVDVVAFSHARGNDRVRSVLREVGPGRYATRIRFARNGLWEFRFVVRHDRNVFTATIRQRVLEAGESGS